MSTSATLPDNLELRFAGMARRVRFIRLLNGFSNSILLAVGTSIFLFASDFFLAFSDAGLRAAVVVQLLVTVLGLIFLAIIPWLRDVRRSTLASLIESAHPQLEERLSSVAGDSWSGSSALFAALRGQAEEISAEFDFEKAVPPRYARERAIVAGAGMLLLVGALAWSPFGSFASRLVGAWFGASTPQPITAVEPAQTMDPVRIAEFTVTVTPPEYAHPKFHAVRVLKDRREDTIVFSEFSRVRYDVRFDRPATSVHILVNDGRIERSNFQMSEDRLRGHVDLPYLPPGEYFTTFHFSDPNDTTGVVCRISALLELRVIRDAPPTFSKLQGPETEVVGDPAKGGKPREARPDETLAFEFTAEDDLGLKSVEVEYRINDALAGSHTVAKLDGETKATREFVLPLAGRVKDGDLFYYRLKATDNRRVTKGSYVDANNNPYPPEDLTGQAGFVPEGWFVLRIRDGAEPLQDPDTLAATLDRVQLAELARRQEELAKQAADPAMKDELERIQAEQAKLSEELQRLLEQSKSLQKAAEAMRALEAQRLSKEAHQLARRQRELAEQAGDNLRQQLLKKLAPLAEKQEKLAEKAAELSKETGKHLEASGLDRFVNDAARWAAEALRDAQGGKALAHQSKSLDDLQRLTRNLEDQGNPREVVRQIAKQQEMLHQKLEKLAQDFGRLQPDMLRQALQDLTKSQRALQEAIKKMPSKADTTEQIKKAEQLAGQIADELPRDAASAFEKMEPLRKSLEQLVQQMPQHDPKAKDDAKAKKQIDNARGLAKEQEELRSAVQQALKEAMGEGVARDDRAKQKQLMDETKRLAEELMELAQKGLPEGGKEKAAEAGQSAQQAEQSMKRSQDQNQAGSPEQGKETAQQAAQQLDQAGVNAAMAASKAEPSMTAEQLRQGQQAMNEAQEDLKQGKGPAASKAMQRAAQAMQTAAGQMTTPPTQGTNTYGGPSNVGTPAARPEGTKTDMPLPKSRAWGEMPGELRTRILQDIRARHGEEYGAIIQHYFEQIANTPEKK